MSCAVVSADDTKYDAVINHTGNDAIHYYNGQPWRWAITIRNLRIKLNGSKGTCQFGKVYTFHTRVVRNTQFLYLYDSIVITRASHQFFICTITPGAGLMIMCYPYTGPSEVKASIARIPHLKRPDTFMHKYSFVLHFADKQCQNESVVGGKGYSLATLTSITTNDVRT